jgi:uncharacterized protein YndB with AHSA1/START domain
MDAVFRALADRSRRQLLDRLNQEDGQSLRALERRLPMTRFGVMKHLRVLEAANLVVTKRRGREKLHFLNPVPIRLIHDRWVSKYAARSEENTMQKVFETYIRTTPERLWKALVDSDQRNQYSFGKTVGSDGKPGTRFENRAPDGSGVWARGENLEANPPRRLVQTLDPLWSEEIKREGKSRITYEIEPMDEEVCRLRVTHDQMREGANDELYGGWPMILSSLKSLLETGKALHFEPPEEAIERWKSGQAEALSH